MLNLGYAGTIYHYTDPVTAALQRYEEDKAKEAAKRAAEKEKMRREAETYRPVTRVSRKLHWPPPPPPVPEYIM